MKLPMWLRSASAKTTCLGLTFLFFFAPIAIVPWYEMSNPFPELRLAPARQGPHWLLVPPRSMEPVQAMSKDEAQWLNEVEKDPSAWTEVPWRPPAFSPPSHFYEIASLIWLGQIGAGWMVAAAFLMAARRDLKGVFR